VAITANNAQPLAAGALMGANTTGAAQAPSSASISIDNQQQAIINKTLFKFLSAFANTDADYRTRVIKAASSTTANIQPMAIIKKTDSIIGDCGGGEFSYSLDVNDQTGSYTGTFVFNNFCSGGATRNGSYPVDGIYILLTDEFETLNENITNLTIDNFIQTGDVSTDFKGFPPLTVISSNLYNKNSSTGKTYWVNDYAFNVIDTGTGLEVSFNGRYYDPDFGYVDVSTTTPFIFDYFAEWPISGELLCVGVDSSVILTVIDDIVYRVDADRNGDGVYEFYAGQFLWSDL
jgi:hypothetical protein